MKAILFFCLTLNAYAWGPIGHRVVGQIAQDLLTPKAKAQVSKLLYDESVAQASTWADFMRSDPKFKKADTWHYVTVSDNKTYKSEVKEEKGDIVEAMERMIAILKDAKKTATEKGEALRFLIHFVGDIHQPLHVGKGSDRGGNDVLVFWFKHETNLHRVWDDHIIDEQKLSYTEYAQFLKPLAVDSAKLNDLNVDNWIKEAQSLRPLIYETKDGKLGYEYQFKVLESLNRQLKLAGHRLGNLLNQIFN